MTPPDWSPRPHVACRSDDDPWGQSVYYDYYSAVPAGAVDAFVRATELGRLVTVGPDDVPHIGLYPFLYLESSIEMHVNRKDEQLADLRGGLACTAGRSRTLPHCGSKSGIVA